MRRCVVDDFERQDEQSCGLRSYDFLAPSEAIGRHAAIGREARRKDIGWRKALRSSRLARRTLLSAYLDRGRKARNGYRYTGT